MRKIIAVLLLFVMFTSCIPLKDQIYFQGDLAENDSLKKIQDEPYRLQVNDLLDIQIKSSDEKLVALFSSTPSGCKMLMQINFLSKLYILEVIP